MGTMGWLFPRPLETQLLRVSSMKNSRHSWGLGAKSTAEGRSGWAGLDLGRGPLTAALLLSLHAGRVTIEGLSSGWGC